MSEWRWTNWGQLGVLHYGKALRGYQGGSGPAEVFGTNGPIGWTDRHLFPPGVVVGRKGAYRGIHYAKRPCWVIDTAFSLETNAEMVDSRWAYWQLRTVDLNAIDSGSAIPSTSRDAFAQIPVHLPPLSVQRAVASVLDVFDDLIENNRRRVAVLEEMARAIYREWFVNFRYPGHKDVPLVDSPLGPIPDDWCCRRLDDVATLVRGRSYRKSELVEDGGLPFVNLKCMMRGGGFRRDGLKRYDGRFTDAQLVEHGDVVLAVTDLTQGREILARATLVPRLAEPKGVISLDVARIVPLVAAERLWIFAALRWSDFPDRVKEYANGSTVLHLSPDHVAAGLVLWPSEHLRKDFVGAIAPMLGVVDELVEASDRLAALRDLLLPKLVSGQIDVSDLDLDALAAC